MERTVYLDNSATTKPSKKAVEYINKALCENWGNPSSLHTMGIDAEITVSDCRQKLARWLSCREDEIIFTSSGTEANNTAIMSVAAARGKKVITSSLEHPSVLETVKRLEALGFTVVRLSCDSEGVVDLSELESQLDSTVSFVSIMLVNNEIGSVQPVKEAVELTRKKAPNALFHCDAVQAFGKMPINVKNLGIDLLTVSGHKIHGPKGIGALYCKKGVNLKAFITGGGQERGLRSGTESVPLIAGFSGALDDLERIETSYKKVTEFNEYAREILVQTGIVEINSAANAFPYILNISVPGFRSETLLHFLERKGVFVSSGSACAKGELSYVLKAVGLSRERIDSALRISFSTDNTKEDIIALRDGLLAASITLRKSKR